MTNRIKSLKISGIALVLGITSQAKGDTGFDRLPPQIPMTEQPMFKHAMAGLQHNAVQRAQEESKAFADRARLAFLGVLILGSGLRAAMKRKA